MTPVALETLLDYSDHERRRWKGWFEADPAVLYVSLHQYPFYPGTGAAGEVGLGAGAGFTVNAPLEAGATDEDYRIVFVEVVLPILQQFDPDLILVSAGFDAHRADPIGGMNVTEAGFAAIASLVVDLAEEVCDGKVVATLEGGYDPPALSRSVVAVLNVLDGVLDGQITG